MSNRVCDCPEACSCYAEGYAAGREKSWFEMGNFDWTQHSRGCSCEPCLAFGKVLVRMLDTWPGTMMIRRGGWSPSTSRPGSTETWQPGS